MKRRATGSIPVDGSSRKITCAAKVDAPHALPGTSWRSHCRPDKLCQAAMGRMHVSLSTDSEAF
jgi:hypothetical protein